MSRDFILADFVSRLNVASKAHMLSVKVRYTDLTVKMLDLFYDNGLIDYFVVLGDTVVVYLRYSKGVGAFSLLKLVSKPSKRIYWSISLLDLIHRCSNFGGFFIISTQFGLLTSNECILYEGVAGETLIEVVL